MYTIHCQNHQLVGSLELLCKKMSCCEPTKIVVVVVSAHQIWASARWPSKPILIGYPSCSWLVFERRPIPQKGHNGTTGLSSYSKNTLKSLWFMQRSCGAFRMPLSRLSSATPWSPKVRLIGPKAPKPSPGAILLHRFFSTSFGD